MAKQYLDKDGLLYFWQKIKNTFAKKSESISNITRSGTTYTATRADGTSFTFTQQDNNTWTANAVNAAGYVAAPTSSNANKVWKTDSTGAPAWRDDANTTYSAATTSANGLMSSTDKTKLDGIATGAEVNQNAFSNVKVGTTTVAADGKTDTLELVAGSNVTLTPDATNDKVTIAATNTTYTPAAATPQMDGTGAVGTSAKYAGEDHVHPSDTSRVPTTRKVNGKELSADVSLDINDVGGWSFIYDDNDTPIKPQRTTSTGEHDLYIKGESGIATDATDGTGNTFKIKGVAATTSAMGMMSAADKTKLNGIATGATANTGTVTKVSTGVGLTGGDITTTGTIKAKLKSETAATYDSATVTNTSGRQYAVVPDKSGYLSVNVPWSNTTYSDATQSAHGLMTAVDKKKLDGINIVTTPSDISDEIATNTGAIPTAYAVGNFVINSLGLFIQTSDKGVANGVVPLNSSATIDSKYLPSYVDDVIEAYARSGQTALSSGWLSATSGGAALTPETGKIYVLMADSGDYAANTQFRWGGSAYVKLADGGVSSITNTEIDTIVAS